MLGKPICFIELSKLEVLIEYNSVKELEHYQRVRRTFEGPSTDQSNSSDNVSLDSKLAAPDPDGHLHAPVASIRPKMKSRASTAKPVKPNAEPKGKGKGKATQWDSDDEDDDAYVTSNDFADTPERRSNGVNGSFEDVGADDDKEIYG